MAVRRKIPESDGTYFVTITCAHWLHLFEEADAYLAVYKWFDYLKSIGHYTVGYVIMPNHLHALIAFSNTGEKSINSLISNGKRFMAYEIVRRLKAREKIRLLREIGSFVKEKDRAKGQRHRVFEPSFDWKECITDKFLQQKLNYIHLNPCRGTWKLAGQPEEYLHSSAKYYTFWEQGIYPVKCYAELEDADLTMQQTKDGSGIRRNKV